MRRSLLFAVMLLVTLASAVAGQDKAPRYHPRFGEAVTLMRSGRWTEAKDLWEDILRAKPLHHEARNNYAVCLIKLGGKDNLRSAETHLNYIIQVLPDKG